MRIGSITVRIPSRKITNEDMLAEIAKLNPDGSPKPLKRYLRDLGFILDRCGSNTRFLRDRESGETAQATDPPATPGAGADVGSHLPDPRRSSPSIITPATGSLRFEGTGVGEMTGAPR
jgi:hypothetical protein